MKKRFKIALLYWNTAIILLGLGLPSQIWWVITGNDFAGKLIKSKQKKIKQLEEEL